MDNWGFTNNENNGKKRKHKNARHLHSGALASLHASFWKRVDRNGDYLEFLNFTGFARESFNFLLQAVKKDVLSTSLDRQTERMPETHHLKRRLFKLSDILAMTLKFLTCTAEPKDTQPHFGALANQVGQCVEVGLVLALNRNLAADPRFKVHWDFLIENMQKCAERTELFIDVPGVAAMCHD